MKMIPMNYCCKKTRDKIFAEIEKLSNCSSSMGLELVLDEKEWKNLKKKFGVEKDGC